MHILRSRYLYAAAALLTSLALLLGIPGSAPEAFASVISASDAAASEAEQEIASGTDVSYSDEPVSPWECAPAQCLAALLVDENSGRVLYDKKAHDRIYPASTTKVLTALLVIEAVEAGQISLEDEIQADVPILNSVIWDASHVSPRIKIDEKLTVENYLYCVMIESDCVCCNILGRHVSGSIDDFVALMNKRASELGCEDTHFSNAHGYPADDHYTTAWSLYLIAREAMKHELFRTICSTNEYTVPPSNIYKKERKLKNSNWLLGMPDKPAVKYDADYTYEPCIGIKTGYSSQAGSCLLSCAQQDGRTLYCVLLGAWALKLPDGSTRRRSFSESKRLLEWGFYNFDEHVCLRSGTIVGKCPISGGGRIKEVNLQTLSDVSAFLPKDINYTDLDMEIELYQHEFTAPVQRGEAAGKLRLSHDGTVVGETELICADRVDLPTTLELFLLRVSGMDDNMLRFDIEAGVLALLLIISLIKSAARRAKRKRALRRAAMERKQHEYRERW